MKPQGLPPLYSPQAVADAILYVAEHPTRDFVVGDAGQMMLLGQRLSPQLMDAFMLLTGFDAQKTSPSFGAVSSSDFAQETPVTGASLDGGRNARLHIFGLQKMC